MTEPNLETNNPNLYNVVSSNEVYPTLKWVQFILFFVLFLALSIIIGLSMGILDAFTETNLVELLTTGYKALYFDAFLFLFTLFIFPSVRKFVMAGMNFRVLKEKKTYFYIFAGILFFYVSQFLLVGLFKIESPEQQPVSLGVDHVKNWGQLFWFTLSIAVITPIKEEILYRGILYKFLEVRHNFWIGFIVSSVIFGIGHVGVPISAGIMGVIFILLFKYTKSLVPSMILHIIWNSIAAFSMFFV